jgi:hypothetical protein
MKCESAHMLVTLLALQECVRALPWNKPGTPIPGPYLRHSAQLETNT